MIDVGVNDMYVNEIWIFLMFSSTMTFMSAVDQISIFLSLNSP